MRCGRRPTMRGREIDLVTCGTRVGGDVKWIGSVGGQIFVMSILGGIIAILSGHAVVRVLVLTGVATILGVIIPVFVVWSVLLGVIAGVRLIALGVVLGVLSGWCLSGWMVGVVTGCHVQNLR
uniref:Uncharacterized protein n=1 Tax=Cacopsylla melanoneura TaxID=428564 RepID=A0A8D8LYQ8_9HEMI